MLSHTYFAVFSSYTANLNRSYHHTSVLSLVLNTEEKYFFPYKWHYEGKLRQLKIVESAPAVQFSLPFKINDPGGNILGERVNIRVV